MTLKCTIFWAMLLFSFFFLYGKTQAQSTTPVLYWEVITKDSLAYMGQILNENEKILRLKTLQSKIVNILQSDILYKRQVDGSLVINKSYLRIPTSTYYLIRPSAIPLRKGEGFYRNVWGLFNQLEYSITDYFSLGGSILITPSIVPVVPTWISLNFTFPTPEENFSVGFGTNLSRFFALPYAQATWGNRHNNFSLGFGYTIPYFGSNEQEAGALFFSGNFHLGKRNYFYTDNYVLVGSNGFTGISSWAWRYAGQQLGVDFGLVFIPIDGNVVAGPWLSFLVPFGG